jgi:hypothetical protein
MKRLSFLLLSLSALVISSQLSCRSPNGPQAAEMNLSVAGTSCTEAWLNLSETNISLPQKVTIIRDGNSLFNFTLTTKDTTLYDSTLAPNRKYAYQLQYENKKGEAVTAGTLDTTSNNITWTLQSFGGEAGSCVLHDVAIINENDIWAVGEIYMKDSTGKPDPLPYNAVHWDGTEWKLKRITVKFRGDVITPPLNGIIAFSSDNIWCAGGLPIQGDGNNWVIYDVRTTTDPTLSLIKLWGGSPNDIYFVGNSGSIAHYNGTSWQKIESGTDLTFLDIYGAMNSRTGKNEILAVCSQNYPSGKGIFSIAGNTATEISSNIPSNPIAELWGIWFVPERHYYLVGDGIYEKKSLSESYWRNGPSDYTHYGTTKVKATGLNDVFIMGAFGECLHFNGKSWKSFRNETSLDNGALTAVAVKENLVICIGANNTSAVIAVGRR